MDVLPIFVNITSTILHVLPLEKHSYTCQTLDFWPSEKCDYGNCSWVDMGLMELDFDDQLLNNATKLLGEESLIRVGGTLCDHVEVDPADRSSSWGSCTCPDPTDPTDPLCYFPWVGHGYPDGSFSGFGKACLPGGRFDILMNFAERNRKKLVFDLSAEFGRTLVGPTLWEGDWDSSNARALFEYIKEQGKEELFYGFELGNEVWGVKTGDAHFSPSQAAKDYALLRQELDEVFGKGKMKILTLSGNWEYVFMTEFIEKFSDWDGVAWHWYPLGAGRSDEVIPNVNDEKFTLTEIRNRLELVNLWQRQHGRDKELWMGETGGAFNSGQNTTTNRFMSHRWYLDQLGIFAQFRHDAYCRQTLIGGNYGLLQRTDGVNSINPDFWGTVLFNDLMGRYVHEVKHSDDEKLHIYVHKNDRNQFVLLAINFNREKSVQIEAINGLADLHVVVWEMTSPDDQSSTVILNGDELPVANTVDVSEMFLEKKLPVQIASKSYVFLRFELN